MEVNVCLSSGRSCSVTLPSQATVHELKAEVQGKLNLRFLRLAFGGQLLDLSSTLSDVGVRDGDSISAIVQPLKLASTHGAFTCYVAGRTAIAWGYPSQGGDTSQVQEQLVGIRQIEGAERAFAAVLGGGSVVTRAILAVAVTAARCERSWLASSRSLQCVTGLSPSCEACK